MTTALCARACSSRRCRTGARGAALGATRLQGRGGRGGPPPTAKAAARSRLHRQLGLDRQRRLAMADDYASRRATTPTFRMNAAARKIADTWDPARDEAAGEACKAYARRPSCASPDACTSPGRMTTR